MPSPKNNKNSHLANVVYLIWQQFRIYYLSYIKWLTSSQLLLLPLVDLIQYSSQIYIIVLCAALWFWRILQVYSSFCSSPVILYFVHISFEGMETSSDIHGTLWYEGQLWYRSHAKPLHYSLTQLSSLAFAHIMTTSSEMQMFLLDDWWNRRLILLLICVIILACTN